MSQSDTLLAYMRSGKRISAAVAVDQWGIYRLASRIYDLRQRGYSVKSERVGRGGRFWASYSLASGQHRL